MAKRNLTASAAVSHQRNCKASNASCSSSVGHYASAVEASPTMWGRQGNCLNTKEKGLYPVAFGSILSPASTSAKQSYLLGVFWKIQLGVINAKLVCFLQASTLQLDMVLCTICALPLALDALI